MLATVRQIADISRLMGKTKVSLPPSAQPVAEALAVFCLRPVTTSIEELLGKEAVAAILEAPGKADAPPADRVRAVVSILAIVLAIGATALPIGNGIHFILTAASLTVAFLVGQPWLVWLRTWLRDRREPTQSKLAKLGENLVQRRNIHSLEELRRNIGKGTFAGYSVTPDGRAARLSGKERACFLADHGRILIVSDDYNPRLAIRARPIPSGEIWIDLAGSTARTQLSAKSLINEPDNALYLRRVAWIREQATRRGITSGALISGLAIVDAFRAPEVVGLDLKEAIPIVRRNRSLPASGDTTISQVHSGNYKEFETALQSLPLDDLP